MPHWAELEQFFDPGGMGRQVPVRQKLPLPHSVFVVHALAVGRRWHVPL
jgi:hypothetical protein